MTAKNSKSLEALEFFERQLCSINRVLTSKKIQPFDEEVIANILHRERRMMLEFLQNERKIIIEKDFPELVGQVIEISSSLMKMNGKIIWEDVAEEVRDIAGEFLKEYEEMAWIEGIMQNHPDLFKKTGDRWHLTEMEEEKQKKIEEAEKLRKKDEIIYKLDKSRIARLVPVNKLDNSEIEKEILDYATSQAEKNKFITLAMIAENFKDREQLIGISKVALLAKIQFTLAASEKFEVFKKGRETAEWALKELTNPNQHENNKLQKIQKQRNW